MANGGVLKDMSPTSTFRTMNLGHYCNKCNPRASYPGARSGTPASQPSYLHASMTCNSKRRSAELSFDPPFDPSDLLAPHAVSLSSLVGEVPVSGEWEVGGEGVRRI